MIALDTFTSQRTFRVLLEALAHPGRVVALPDDVRRDGRPPVLVVPLALADLGRRVAIEGPDAARWGSELASATSCRLEAPADADEVVVLGGLTDSLVTSLRRGTALAPELGCRLSVACDELGNGDVLLDLRGPGVPSRRQVAVAGVPASALRALAAANAEFPCGIDAFLVAADGTVVGLPRSLSIDVQEVR